MTWPPPCIDGTTNTALRIIGANLVGHEFIGCPTPYTLTPGSTLRGMTPYTVRSRPVGVDIAGEVITNIRAQPRNIACPIVIHGTTETELETAIGDLGAFLSTLEGTCRLVWKRADNTRREIAARYLSGADTIRIENLAGHRHVVANLVFRAYAPYWEAYGSVGQSIGGTFLDAAAAGITHTTWTNDGDVRTWPIFEFTAPCERIEIGNVTTGQMFRVLEVLSGTQVVRVETDPRSRGVYLDDVWRPDIIDPTAADMWPLLPGVNHIVLRAISPGDAGSWTVLWVERFETC